MPIARRVDEDMVQIVAKVREMVPSLHDTPDKGLLVGEGNPLPKFTCGVDQCSNPVRQAKLVRLPEYLLCPCLDLRIGDAVRSRTYPSLMLNLGERCAVADDSVIDLGGLRLSQEPLRSRYKGKMVHSQQRLDCCDDLCPEAE